MKRFYGNIQIMEAAINEHFGYDYIKRDVAIRLEIVITKQKITDFIEDNEHIETWITKNGKVEIFTINGRKLNGIMDFGEYRILMRL